MLRYILFYQLIRYNSFPKSHEHDSLVVARLFANDFGHFWQHWWTAPMFCMKTLSFPLFLTHADHFWLIVVFYPHHYHDQQSPDHATTPHTHGGQPDPLQSQPRTEITWRLAQVQQAYYPQASHTPHSPAQEVTSPPPPPAWWVSLPRPLAIESRQQVQNNPPTGKTKQWFK